MSDEQKGDAISVKREHLGRPQEKIYRSVLTADENGKASMEEPSAGEVAARKRDIALANPMSDSEKLEKEH